MLELLQYDDDSLPFMYQKTLILLDIFKTYKEIYIGKLRTSLKNDENKFKVINDC
ncbi:hypothetical protein MDAP_000538, partial [Mitosporidium daphniae]